MKPHFLLLLPFTASLALAGPRTSASYSIQTDTIDLGQCRTTSANYRLESSVSGLAGVSNVATQSAKHGCLAQLFDATFLATAANAVTWSIASGPLASISASGGATAALVFENSPATVEGTFGGFTAPLNLTVLDTIPDNFGGDAGNGLGDGWQGQFFGENNPQAAPALDPDGDGADNLFEFTAGLAPNASA